MMFVSQVKSFLSVSCSMKGKPRRLFGPVLCFKSHIEKFELHVISQGFCSFNGHQNDQESLLKHSCWTPYPRVSDSVGLGWDASVCISSMLPGDAYFSGPGTTLWEPLL